MTDPNGETVLFGECRFRNDQVDVDVLDELMEEAPLFTQFIEKHYCLFSRSGFTESLVRRAGKEKIMSIDIGKIYE